MTTPATSHDSITHTINLGKAVCHAIRVGTSPGDVGRKTGNLGYSRYQLGKIMAAAAIKMCPDITPVLRAYAAGDE